MLCAYFEHHKRVSFEGTAAEPETRTVTNTAGYQNGVLRATEDSCRQHYDPHGRTHEKAEHYLGNCRILMKLTGAAFHERTACKASSLCIRPWSVSGIVSTAAFQARMRGCQSAGNVRGHMAAGRG